MGAKSEALAKRFEVKAREAMATLEQLSEADWTKVTAAEKWPVGVTAHPLAGDQLAKSGTVFTGAPSMTAGQLITRGLLDHTDEHFGSIRKTVGHGTGR